MNLQPHLAYPNFMKGIGIQLCISSIAIIYVLRLWNFHWLTPFNYHGDTIYQLALVKSISEGGWIWFIDRLGAPYSLAIGAFPQNLTFSSLIMKVIALFSNEPGLILNLFWIISILMTSVTSFIALQYLGINPKTSWAISTLYALLPYTLYRNTSQICLTYIFVPIIAAYAIETLGKNLTIKKNSYSLNSLKIPKYIIGFALAGIGFDYIYNAFFASFFLFITGLLTWIQNRSAQAPKKMAFSIAIIVGCALINFFPTVLIWHDLGIPATYKSVADAEVYGLKLRHMLGSPALGTLFPSIGKVEFPLENENTSAVLGGVGAIGLIGSILFGLLGGGKKEFRLLWAAGVLCIAGILLGTIGGLGAIFSLIISPDIRAYNRISIFIGFFALFTFAALFDFIQAKYKSYNYPIVNKIFWPLILLCIFAVGLYDQSLVARPYLNRKNAETQKVSVERTMVKKIESIEPPIRQIYLLPETTFPVDSGIQKMGAYDHGRPYIWSQKIKWSWPNYSRRQQEWLNILGSPLGPLFINTLVNSGFDGLWVDCYGLDQNISEKLKRKLEAEIGSPILVSDDRRYYFYKLPLPQNYNQTLQLQK